MSDINNPSSTSAVQTTGHAWDGDLQEFNNPLPRWWLWSFYASVVIAVLYWFVYPSWPVGDGYLTGLKSVAYPVGERTEVTSWNTRARLMDDLHNSDAARQQQTYMQRVADTSYQDIVQDPEMLAFVRSVGRGLFGDNCAACHGRGGQGVMSMYPNLADDAWLWGGDMEAIEQTLIMGRQGFMPAYGEVLDADQLDDVAEYVLFLSGQVSNSEAVRRGGAIFQGMEGGCYYCHDRTGKGLPSQGAANLTDQIWTLVDVPGAESALARKSALTTFISQGVHINQRVMPAWQERLSPTAIKVLAVYVHQLGGGQ